MSSKRIFAAMLCASLLLSAVACSSEDTQDTTSDTTADTSAAVETETSPYDPGLPDRDFGGEDFIFAVRGTESDYEWDIKDVEVDGITGDPVNDAVYERTSFLEEKYNVDIDALCCGPLGSDGTMKIVSDAIMTNDDSFEAILNAVDETTTYAINKYLVDMNTIENLDLTRSWWDQNAINSFSFGNKIYFTTGEITTTDNLAVMVLFFDKAIVDMYELDDPYQDVRDGKWTFDKMVQNSEIVTSDLNGDGKMNEDDRFGFIYWTSAYIALLHGMGNSIGEIGEDGMPRQTLQTERFVDSWMKMNAYQKSGTALARKTDLDLFRGNQGDAVAYMLESQNVLYSYVAVADILIYRDIEADFGIIPYPKFDEEQESYHNTCSTFGASAVSVPITNTDLDATGFLLEAYCAKSAELVTPAFYDKQLTRKGVRDEESAEMLELVFATVKYDIGDVFNWGSISGTISSLFDSKRDTIASAIEKNITKVEADVQNTIKQLLDTED